MGAIKVSSVKEQRIMDFLKRELGLPETTIAFELHISLDKCIMVRNLDFYVPDDVSPNSENPPVWDSTRMNCCRGNE